MTNIIPLTIMDNGTGRVSVIKLKLKLEVSARTNTDKHDHPIIIGPSMIKLRQYLLSHQQELKSKQNYNQYTTFCKTKDKFETEFLLDLEESILQKRRECQLEECIDYVITAQLNFDYDLLSKNTIQYKQGCPIQVAQIKRAVSFSIDAQRCLKPDSPLILPDCKLSCLNAVVFEIENHLGSIHLKGTMKDFNLLRTVLQSLYDESVIQLHSNHEFSIRSTHLIFINRITN